MSGSTGLAAPASGSGSRRAMQFVLRLREAGVLVFLVVLGTLFSLLTATFLSVQNLTTVASSAAILAIADQRDSLAMSRDVFGRKMAIVIQR